MKRHEGNERTMAIYFDNGATSYPKPEAVYQAMDAYMRENGASAGRGNYQRAMRASELVYETRKAVAKVLGIKRPSKIVFTTNITESLNTVIKGFVEPGDMVLTTNYEHNAMWRPLKRLEAENGVTISVLNCSKNGIIDFAELENLLRKRPKLFCFAHGSNVLGNVLPLSEVAKTAHDFGVPILVDTAQTAGVVPLNTTDLEIDFLAFTGHKSLMGPMGTGGLYIHGDSMLKTLKEGGTGSASLSPFQPENPPDRYESGTINVPALVGLKSAAEYIDELGVDKIDEHEQRLIKLLMKAMGEIPEITLYGARDTDPRLGLVSFNIDKCDPYTVAAWLDQHYDIMVRAGLHCSPQAHRLIGTEQRGAVRISLNWFNTEADVKTCVDALADFIETRGR